MTRPAGGVAGYRRAATTTGARPVVACSRCVVDACDGTSGSKPKRAATFPLGPDGDIAGRKGWFTRMILTTLLVPLALIVVLLAMDRLEQWVQDGEKSPRATVQR
jgi:hypothetical protein